MRQVSGPPALIANRYRLLYSLGEGGFGEVFCAEDLKFDPPRRVALKLLHDQLLSDPQVRADLKREAGILASFNHPNILKILDFEVMPNLAYIITELAEAGSLENKLHPNSQQSPVAIPFPLVKNYLEQICRALDEIHQQGRIHRDIKPANILLDSTGRVLLADFGVALTASSNSSRLLTSVIAWGTAEYAAPEVWDDQVGKASDIYALGILLYQMLTGYAPYQGSNPALMKQHLTEPMPPLSKYAPGLVYPPALDAVIARAVAKNPRDRYRKAGELYQAFQTALETPTNPSLLRSVLKLVESVAVTPAVSQPVTTPAGPSRVKSQPQAGPNRNELDQHLNYLLQLFEKSERLQDWDSALEISQLILNLDKNHEPALARTAQVYKERAFVSLEKHEYRYAFRDFMNSIKYDPALNDSRIGNFRHYVLAASDFIKAFNTLLKILRPERSQLGSGANYGPVATYDFNRAIELEPYRGEHYFERGRYMLSKGDYDRAIRDFTHALELETDNFMKTCYYRERGLAFEKKGNRRAARRDYREADKYLRLATNF